MTVFDRVVVGVDGTELGYEALRQVLGLRPAGGVIEAVTALDIGVSAQAGFMASHVASQLEQEAEHIRETAEQIMADCSGCSARIVRGEANRVLRLSCAEMGATVIAVGGRRSSRFLGIVLGDTTTALLHESDRSVFVARSRSGRPWSPKHIVVGVDGSPAALAALEAAQEISARLGSDLEVVTTTGGKPIDRDGLWTERVTAWDGGHPAEALLDRSLHADLTVVGSTGLHGVRALGSVSERVAHRVPCSVLVVRATPSSG